MPELPEGFEVVQGQSTQAPAIPEGFDIVQPGQEMAAPAQLEYHTPTGMGYGADTIFEAMAAVNRGAIDILDLPATLANSVLELSGSGRRVPKIGESAIGRQGTVGGFMEPGIARDVVRSAGELAAPAPPVIQAGKQASQLVSKADDTAKIAAEIPDLLPSLPPARVPGASSSRELVDAATSGSDEVRKFIQNPMNPEFAEYTLKGGELVRDKAAKQAINQGLDRGLVSMIKTTTPSTRKMMRGMVEMVKRGKADRRFADANRPWDIAGKALDDRVKWIRSVNQKAGKEINKVANTLRGEMVNYSSAIDNFTDELNDLGVVLVRNNKGDLVPDFTQSAFATSAKPKKIVNDLVKVLGTDVPVDAHRVHIVKKQIDDLVNWGKNATGNAGQVEGVAKRLRGDLNRILGESFPEYRAVNKTYSETKDALESIAKASGVKLSPDDAGFYQALGTGSRRILSNAQSGAPLRKAVSDLDSLANKYGADMDDSITDLVSFADEMDALFGPAAKTSLAGEMAKTTGKAAETAIDAAAGQQTMTGLGVEAAKGLYRKAKGQNEENAIKALETLLSTQY